MTTLKNAITPRDFEVLRDDVSGSPLWNRDLAPTTIKERTWSTWNIAALWISASAFSTGVFVTTYMLGTNFIQRGMKWWQAIITILLANSLVLIPMILNAHAGTKYGVSFPVLCRASFGTKGAHIPAILRAIIACVWSGILTYIGGLYLDALLSATWSGWPTLFGQGGVWGLPFHSWMAFFLFWLIQVFIILKRMDGIKSLETWSAPLLLAAGILVLVWASWRAGGLGRALTESSALQNDHPPFWHIFPGALTEAFGYWAILTLNIPDFTRYARSQRSQMLGQALGLPLAMTAFAFIGVAVASATMLIYRVSIPHPVTLVTTFRGATVMIFAMLVILAAQLATNMSANVVAPANVFSNLYPKRISYVSGGLITALIGIIIMPWRLLRSMGRYIPTWLTGYSALIGAIAGILICDYWVLRKRRLSLADLFETGGIYSYSQGINWRAVITLGIAIAPVAPGFVRAVAAPEGEVTNPNFFDTLYTYAWFITFGIGFVVYYVLMKGQISRE
jgi:nucleobase:cation symporter-1, NCS1 family